MYPCHIPVNLESIQFRDDKKIWLEKQRLRWNWQKIQQKLSKTLRLNFCYLEIIRFLHPRFYHIFGGCWGKNIRAYSKKSGKKSESDLMTN